MKISKTATATAVEVRWILLGGCLLIRRYLGPVVVASALALLDASIALRLWGVVLLTAIVLRIWARAQPASFARVLGGPAQGVMARRKIKKVWPELIDACDLRCDEKVKPSFSGLWPRVEMVVRPGVGRTTEHFRDAAEAIRMAVGAAQIRVEPRDVASVSMLFTFGDELGLPFEARAASETGGDLDRVNMGKRADGQSWFLPVGPHTLVAGSSGAGKGSIFWSFAFGLAPAVRAGQVQLHGIDLKGGMEILMGEGLFTTRATSASEAVAVLELLVEWMQRRASSYAGRVRSHHATLDEPLHVVMVDELAALTAYSTDREMQRRGEIALNLLCSQGRAVGFMVFACLQDPRKEVIPSRGLFTQMIGLRLKDLSETTMVLGELAAQSGAHCHRITRETPGTGYVVPEEGGHPIRVRAGFASDEEIRRVATSFATPTRLSVLEPSRNDLARGRSTAKPGVVA